MQCLLSAVDSVASPNRERAPGSLDLYPADCSGVLVVPRMHYEISSFLCLQAFHLSVGVYLQHSECRPLDLKERTSTSYGFSCRTNWLRHPLVPLYFVAIAPGEESSPLGLCHLYLWLLFVWPYSLLPPFLHASLLCSVHQSDLPTSEEGISPQPSLSWYLTVVERLLHPRSHFCDHGVIRAVRCCALFLGHAELLVVL